MRLRLIVRQRAQQFAKLRLEQLEVRRVLDGHLSIVALELADTVELSLTEDHERLTAAALRDLNGDGYADLIVAGLTEAVESSSELEPESTPESPPVEASSPGEAEPTSEATAAAAASTGGDDDVTESPMLADDAGEPVASSESTSDVEVVEQDENASTAESSVPNVFVDAYLFEAESGEFSVEPIAVFAAESTSEITQLEVRDLDEDGFSDVFVQMQEGTLNLFSVQSEDGLIRFDSSTPECDESCDASDSGEPMGQEQNASHSALGPEESFVATYGEQAVLHLQDLNQDGAEELVAVSSYEVDAALQVWSVDDEAEFTLVSSTDLAGIVSDVTFGSFQSEETFEVLVRYQDELALVGDSIDLFSISSDLTTSRYELPSIHGSSVAINPNGIVAFELGDQSVEIATEPTLPLFLSLIHI